ncbi:hypothetical protein LZ198_01980 [Myxococcus sp. K15C18031901]|uniref:hypothetical protein n=1 Tax=Myxococcus dinghuensis TaxID=2906761 RepID=UPI0020A8131C|nr:hypothetical protein [Myxococcus dinghuensis]MCP3097640.1 hypothetical protein [Myxococcus dinghuensis]
MPTGPVRQFIHGLSLPFHIGRALLADPVARRQYLRVACLQTLAALVLALTCMGSAREASKPKADEESRQEAKTSLAESIEDIANAVAQETDDPSARGKALEVARRLEAKRTAREAVERVLAPSLQQSDAAHDKARQDLERRLQEGEAARSRAQRLLERTREGGAAGGGPTTADARPEGSPTPSPTTGEPALRQSSPPEQETPAPATAQAPAPAADPGEVAAHGESDPTASPAANEEAQVSEALDSLDDDDLEELSPALRERIRDLQTAAKEGKDRKAVAQALAALFVELNRGEDTPASGAPPASANEATTDAEPAKTTVKTKTDARTRSSSRAPKVRTNIDTDDDEGEGRGWFARRFSYGIIAFWVALFAALQLAQWVVLALSRDYHDVVSRNASLLTGVEPEDEALRPRLRINFQWLQKKVRRRWRAMILFAVGVPAVAFLASPFFCFGLSSPVFTAISSLWGMWWLVVFTAAKSARAWEPVASQTAPWFLRGWTWLTTRVPGLRWGVLQRYGATWNKRSAELFAPMASVERHPYAYAGLAFVRFVGSFAPLKFFVRPLIPVASAHILDLEHHARREAAEARGDEPPQTPAPGHGGTEEAIRVG